MTDCFECEYSDDCNALITGVCLKGEDKMPTQEEIYNELAKSMATEYANYIADEIKDAVIQDIEATADAEPNDDDLRLAIGRVLCERLGVSV